MNNNIKFPSILLSIIIYFTLTSCIRTPKGEPGVVLPKTFNGSQDSSSIGFLERRQLFPDTNLLKLIDTAIYNNYALKAANQRIYAAAAELSFAKGRFLPVIAPEVSTRVDKYGTYTLNGVGNFDTNLSPNIKGDKKIPDPTPDLFFGLRTAWEIGFFGKFRNMRRAAGARFLAYEKGRQWVVTTLVADIATMYYDLLALDNELLTIRNNMELQRTALEMIRIIKESARTNELAVKQFEAQLLNTKALESRKIQEIIEAENKLNALLGRFPQSIPRGRPIREQVFPSNIREGIPSQMLLNRPDIFQSEQELVAARADVKAARASFFPSLTLGGYLGQNSFSANTLLSPQSLAWGAVAGLTSPFFNQFTLRSNFRRVTAAQSIAFYNYQQSIVQGFQEVTGSLNGIKNYENVYLLKQQETDALYQAVSVSKDLFSVGMASYLEVITAQKNVLQAELELSDARKEQFISLINLYKALGGGWK